MFDSEVKTAEDASHRGFKELDATRSRPKSPRSRRRRLQGGAGPGQGQALWSPTQRRSGSGRVAAGLGLGRPAQGRRAAGPRRGLAAGAQELARPNSHEVIVHVEADVLSSDASGARCEIDGAGAIAPETARRLTCDSALLGLVESNGEPLSIGRRSRRVPHGLRRALEARDRTCRFPGCANLARLDSHHVVHYAPEGAGEGVDVDYVTWALFFQ